MTDIKPIRRLPRGLLTRDQVLAALRRERGLNGLTKTAEKYGLAVSQICDVLAIPARAKLSKRMAEALRFRLIELYEHMGED